MLGACGFSRIMCLDVTVAILKCVFLFIAVSKQNSNVVDRNHNIRKRSKTICVNRHTSRSVWLEVLHIFSWFDNLEDSGKHIKFISMGYLFKQRQTCVLHKSISNTVSEQKTHKMFVPP